MSVLTFPQLVYRLTKGAELTFAEGDDNLKMIRTFCIALQNILQGSLNDDGTLKPGSVGVKGIPIFTDIGTANRYAVTPAPAITAYANDQVFFIYTTNASSAAATLNVNGLGNIPIKSNGADIVNQIGAQSVFVVVYRDGVFVLLAGGGGGGGGIVINEVSFSGQQVFNSDSYTLSGVIPASVAHGLGANPSQFEAVVTCLADNSGFTAGQLVPAGEITLVGGGKAFLFSWDTQHVFLQLLGAAYVINPNTQASVAIDATKWAVSFQASLMQTFNQAVFPALEYSFASPQGAWSYRKNLFVFQHSKDAALYALTKTNILNNEAAGIVSDAIINYSFVNGTVFGSSFFGGGILPKFVFGCASGIYSIPAVDPNDNVIPPNTAYDGGGASAAISIPSSSTFTWTPAPGDVSLVSSIAFVGGLTTLLASDGVQTFITTAAANQSIVLNGIAGGACNATISTSGIAWTPAQFNSVELSSPQPAWMTYAAGNIQLVYACSGTVGAVNCYKISSVASTKNTWAATNVNPLNLTSNSIANVAAFKKWHKAGSAATIILFQYNPVNKRVYVATSETGGMIHIFQLTSAGNDFSTWWNTAARETQMIFVKTVGLAGSGGAEVAMQSMAVEVDQVTGSEKAIVFVSKSGQEIVSFEFPVAAIPKIVHPLVDVPNIQAHGLERSPQFIECYLKCTIANGGYAPGQLIPIAFQDDITTGGVYCYFDATNFYYSVVDTVKIPKTNGVGTEGITNADWSLVIVAGSLSLKSGEALIDGAGSVTRVPWIE